MRISGDRVLACVSSKGLIVKILTHAKSERNAVGGVVKSDWWTLRARGIVNTLNWTVQGKYILFATGSHLTFS